MSLPLVSVVIPCRNERAYIGACLDSVLASEYPAAAMEILVADGMSEDGTRDVIAEYARRDPRVKLLDNPKRILASAWNAGIRAARGEIIMALNAHTVFPPAYVPTCISLMSEYPEAAYIGGVVRTKPQDDTPLGRALALAVSHPFGVGGSRFRTGTAAPEWADTAAFGGYRRGLFSEIGLFNEELVRSQDMELHLRLQKAGKRILLAPQMVGDYYTRTKLGPYLRYCFINGLWLTLPLKYSPHMLSLRHSVPLVFVLTLALTLAGGFFDPRVWWLTLGVAGAYGVANLVASGLIAVQRRDPAYVLFMPFAFAALHVLYGIGAFVGITRALCSRRFWTHFTGETSVAERIA